MELEAEIDRLYGLPLDEFVGERGDLARTLRRDGDRDAAEVVAKLRKPTVGAWALNQAVRIRRSERDELLAAGERLRDAHEALLAGAGDADALRGAMTDERALAASLADAAEAIATEAGRSGPALKERVRATLHAAAVDEEVRTELAAGRIVKEREGVGIGPFALTAPAAAPKAGAKGAASAKGAAAAKGGKGNGAPAKGASAKGSGSAKGGKVSAEEKRAAAEARREEAAKAKEAAAAERAAEAERRKRLKVAEQAVAAAHGALADAKAAADEAAEVVEDAKEALATAQAAEREARQLERERVREVTKRERDLDKLKG